MKKIVSIVFLSYVSSAYCQNVGINATGSAPVSSAALDVDMVNKGVLVPRVALTSRILFAPIIGTPTVSLLVYNTATAGVSPNNVVPGYYYWDGAVWVAFAGVSDDWSILGNAGTASTTNFLGTTDNQDLVFQRNNVRSGLLSTTNTSFGVGALNVSSSGGSNCAFGISALLSNTGGSGNVAVGRFTLENNLTGNANVAIGNFALRFNQNGIANVAIGESSLRQNVGGNNNTAVGISSLSNSLGSLNTAVGSSALNSNTTGYANVAVGYNALLSNTTAYDNNAFGRQALEFNVTGIRNMAAGSSALKNNISGTDNAAFGNGSLSDNTSGDRNSAFGKDALDNNTTGTNNSSLGFASNVSAVNLSNSTAIGASSIVNASNKVRIGSTTVTVVEGPVNYTVSDGRFKTNITEEVQGLSFITRLRPVVYNFDTQKFDDFLSKDLSEDIKKNRSLTDFGPSTAIRQTGFIAQEVEQAAIEIGYDFNGVHVPESENDNYSISYSSIVVPLVKAVQEQQVIIEDLKKQINSIPNNSIDLELLKAENADLKIQMNELKAILLELKTK
ncbi:MAG: hypothetical protein ACI9N1_001318 [Flavobacteriales bacterium]|jgi:hypothetical protein